MKKRMERRMEGQREGAFVVINPSDARDTVGDKGVEDGDKSRGPLIEILAGAELPHLVERFEGVSDRFHGRDLERRGGEICTTIRDNATDEKTSQG